MDIRYYNWQGRKLPSVTSILGVIEKPGLLDWAVRVTAQEAITSISALAQLAEIRPDEAMKLLASRHTALREEAASHGTELHSQLEQALNGQGGPMAEAVEKFLDEIGVITVEATESMVVNSFYGYAGTMDALVLCEAGYAVVDFKTGNRIYPEHHLQLAAYANAEMFFRSGDLIGTPMPKITVGYIGKVETSERNLTASIKPHRVWLSDNLFQVFLGALRVFDFFYGKHSDLHQ